MSEEKIARLQEVIRQVCLNRDIWNEGSANNIGLQALCKELVTYIDSEDKLRIILRDLPNGTHETIAKAYITYRISEINSLDSLLDALEKNPNGRDQIIKACEKELSTIKTAEQLGSVDKLNLILKMLPEEMVPILGKDLIELSIPLFKTRKQLANSLAVSKNTRLQEAFIDALCQSGRLVNLICPGSKKDILKHFQNNPIYYGIINEEMSPDCSFNNLFWSFLGRKTGHSVQVMNAENQCEGQLRR